MKYVLRFFGFGGMLVGLSGMAESDNMPLALGIVCVSALLLGLDSIMEDYAINKKHHSNNNNIIESNINRPYFLP